MLIEELESRCLLSVLKGYKHITLVVPRRSPPTRDYIRVKGLGQGYVMNAQERDGRWEIVASFEVKKILDTIKKQRKLNELHTSG